MIQSIKVSEVPHAIKVRTKAVRMAVIQGVRSGARRGRTRLVRATPKDRGMLKAGWQVRPGIGNTLVELSNDVPYLGIVELGARPHQVSLEGRAALAGWARRNIPGLKEGEDWAVAEGIANKLAAEGQKPTYFIRNELPNLRNDIIIEINRFLKMEAARKRK